MDGVKKTLKEFKRILKPDGYLVNLTMGNDDIIAKYTYELYQKYKNEYAVNSSDRYKKGISNYSDNYHTFIDIKNIKLTEEQFIGLEFSQSSAPKQSDKIHDTYKLELQNI